jgi:hypothetical protein
VHSVLLTRGILCKFEALRLSALKLTRFLCGETLLTLLYRCFGAASAKERLDVVIRDAINAGDIAGPRYLANGKEMARRDGDLVAGITAYADGPDETRSVIQHHIKLGVDTIKLSMSGEDVGSFWHHKTS